jgi:hypothetical protein
VAVTGITWGRGLGVYDEAFILLTLVRQIAAHERKARVGELPEVMADRMSMEQVMGNISGTELSRE